VSERGVFGGCKAGSGFGKTSFYVFNDSIFILTDLKLHLQSTDYANFLNNVPSPLQVSQIDDNLKEKLVTEFQHMRNHATGPLATFLDFITYRYIFLHLPYKIRAD
jgi:hypothetical protein